MSISKSCFFLELLFDNTSPDVKLSQHIVPDTRSCCCPSFDFWHHLPTYSELAVS
jgi:hypothetical protein